MISLGRQRRFAAALAAAALLWIPAAHGAAPPDLQAIAELIQTGRPAEAEAALRQRLEDREDPAARDLLGVALGAQGRVEEAEVELRRAVEAAPEVSEPRQHLARILITRERPAAAVEQLRAAARTGLLERDLGLYLAAAERAAGNGEEADRLLAEAAERHGSVRARMELARIAAGRGDHDRALRELQAALAVAPNSEAVLRAHAEVSLAAGAPAAAAWSLEPLTRLYPDVPEYPYLLGVARLRVGDSGGATEALERSLDLAPDRPLTLIALGLAHNAQKRFEESREVLQRGLRLAPESAEAMAALAEAEEGLGNLADAERYARRALDRVPGQPLAHLVLGMVGMKQGEYEAARDHLLRAVEANPHSIKGHYQLSLAYTRLGDPESSARHLAAYRESVAAMQEALTDLATRTGAERQGDEP